MAGRGNNPRPASAQGGPKTEEDRAVSLLTRVADANGTLAYKGRDGKVQTLGYVDRLDPPTATENATVAYIRNTPNSDDLNRSAVQYRVKGFAGGGIRLEAPNGETIIVTPTFGAVGDRAASKVPVKASGKASDGTGEPPRRGETDATPVRPPDASSGDKGGPPKPAPAGRTGQSGGGTGDRKAADAARDGQPAAASKPAGPAAPPSRPAAGSNSPGRAPGSDDSSTAGGGAAAPAAAANPEVAVRAPAPPAGTGTAAERTAERRRNARTAPEVDTTPASRDDAATGAAAGAAQQSLALHTPKYVKGVGSPRTDGYRDTMARLFLWLTPAQLKRVQSNIPQGDSRTRELLDKIAAGPDRETRGYIEFLLQEVNAGFSEKIVPLSGLADQYANYAYGANAPTFSFRAVLLNNRQDDQAANMLRLYLNVLRALQTAKTRVEVHLVYDQTLVTGAMVNYQWTLRSEDESACSCTFQIVARSVVQNYGMPREVYEGWSSAGRPVPVAVLSAISVDTTDPAQAPWVYASPVNLLPPRDTEGANYQAGPAGAVNNTAPAASPSGAGFQVSAASAAGSGAANTNRPNSGR